MLSKKQVLQYNPQLKVLINAVINRIGLDAVNDVNNHGINGGFNGFIYYSDTCKFYSRYRKIINTLIFDMANDLGEDPVNMVASFNCVNDDHDTRHDIGICIYGGNLKNLKDDTHVPNALAWFAAEEIYRLFDN